MQIDFYLLKNDLEQATMMFACQILEKAYSLDHKVFVCTKDKEDAFFLDELLWTYKPSSFIPHNIQGEGPEPPPSIQIGYLQEPRGFNDILINLTDTIPIFHKKFTRIIEIIENKDASKESGRIRFREYKKYNYKLVTHDIDNKQSPCSRRHVAQSLPLS